MNDSEEVALVRRSQRGDTEAYRELVETHRGVLFGTAYLMTRDRGPAEDAVQRALLQMWRHLPSLRLHSSFRAWLVRIVVNEVRQQLRKKQVPTVPLEQMSEMAEDFDDVEKAMIHDEERQ